MNKSRINDYWELFLKTTGNLERYGKKQYTSWYFDNKKEAANYLVELVLKGIKKGTASLYDSFIFNNEPIPKNGDISIITDWDGVPKCIIESININLHKYCDVPESFAEIEGEGDKTLKYWKKVHYRFFSEEALRIKKTFTDNSIVVCEEFRVIYPINI